MRRSWQINLMWLLDVNLPNGLVEFLRQSGFPCDTTVARGWRDLGNGILSEAAFQAGFRCILTRDKLFGESSGKALKNFPELSVVIIRIKQAREIIYLDKFREAWNSCPIQPVAGSVIEWPQK